jgi:hypothetical protein
VQQTVVGVATVAVPEAWPPVAVHVPLAAVGAVVSSSPATVTPSIWQPERDPKVTSVPPHVPVFMLKPSTTAPEHETPVGEPHEHPLQARESLTPP